MKSEEEVTPATVEGTGSLIDTVASGATTTRNGKNLSHAVYRVCDTVYCKRCGKQWGVSDNDIPNCETKPRSRYLRIGRGR